jgi:Transposase IS116/IS110/IS902 family
MQNTALKIEPLNPVQRLTKDLAAASATLSDQEARYLVDLYYQMQENRIRAFGQVRSMEGEEPNTVLEWVAGQGENLENQIKRALDKYTDGHPVGAWAKSQIGIGPVIAAGMCANIGDPTRFKTAGNLFSYSGMAPSQRRKRGEKSNWSASLKRLCWIAGQSFVKTSNHEDSVYGKLYREKKEYYVKKNEAGDYADRAKECLEQKKYGKDTEAYKAYSKGKLPPAHIQAMAERFAAKLFLAHFWEVGLRLKGIEPPQPYAIAILKHAHLIEPKM